MSRTLATTFLSFALLLQVSTVRGQEASPIPGAEFSFYLDGVETRLAPQRELTEQVRSSLAQLEPRVGIEVSVPIAVRDQAFTPEGRLEIYNILRSISTMEGIEYYSASRERMRTFYAESHAIAGPDDRDVVADPLVDSIPRRDTVYAYQRDLSFGRNVQRLDYTSAGDATLVQITNETTMVYRVVPLVTPGNLQVYMIIEERPEAGELIFYGNVGVRVPTLFGLADRARDSFTNRIVALHGWFRDQIDEAGLAAQR